MDDGQRRALGLGGQLVAKDLAEQSVHDGVEAFFGEAIPILLGFPHVDVAQTALGECDGDVAEQPFRVFVADQVDDALLEGSVDRNILGERICHGWSPAT
jgi:hypothetical protein